jgi:hypothetical protein
MPKGFIEYLEYSNENKNDIKNALRKTTFELKKTKLKKSHPLSKTIF